MGKSSLPFDYRDYRDAVGGTRSPPSPSAFDGTRRGDGATDGPPPLLGQWSAPCADPPLPTTSSLSSWRGSITSYDAFLTPSDGRLTDRRGKRPYQELSPAPSNPAPPNFLAAPGGAPDAGATGLIFAAYDTATLGLARHGILARAAAPATARAPPEDAAAAFGPGPLPATTTEGSRMRAGPSPPAIPALPPSSSRGSLAPLDRHPNFPETLHAVLSSPAGRGIVAWLPDGQGFAIRDKARFVSCILSTYFDGAQFPSFTRRLKRWNFVRKCAYPDRLRWFHPHFRRGRPDLARRMTYGIAGGGRLMAEDDALSEDPPEVRGEEVEQGEETESTTLLGLAQNRWQPEKSEEPSYSPPSYRGQKHPNDVDRLASLEKGQDPKQPSRVPSGKHRLLRQDGDLHREELACRFGFAHNGVLSAAFGDQPRQWLPLKSEEPLVSASSDRQRQRRNDSHLHVSFKLDHVSKTPSRFSSRSEQQRRRDVDPHTPSTPGRGAGGKRGPDGVGAGTAFPDGAREDAAASVLEALRRNNRRVVEDQARLTQRMRTLSRTHLEIMTGTPQSRSGGASVGPLLPPQPQRRRAPTMTAPRARDAPSCAMARPEKKTNDGRVGPGRGDASSHAVTRLDTKANTGFARAGDESFRVMASPLKKSSEEKTKKNIAAPKISLAAGENYPVGLPPLKKRICRPPAA